MRRDMPRGTQHTARRVADSIQPAMRRDVWAWHRADDGVRHASSPRPSTCRQIQFVVVDTAQFGHFRQQFVPADCATAGSGK